MILNTHMIAPIIRIYHMMFSHPYDTSHALFIHVDMLESGTAVQDAIPVNLTVMLYL